MGFRTFTAGEVLTAANVMTYLMKQVVITCTSGTRPSSPVDGMVIYQTDTSTLHFYRGGDANWKRFAMDQETHDAGQATETTSQNSITSTSWAAGSANCYEPFTAPPSGNVFITVSGNLSQSSNGNTTQLSYEIRDSATAGSGSEIVAPSTFRCIASPKAVVTSGPAFINGSFGPYLHTGLTPGSSYNVRTMHTVTGGTGTIAFRAVMVNPEI